MNNRATTTSPLVSLLLSPNVQQDSSGNVALGGASSSMVNFSVDGISTTNVRQNGALQDAYPSQEGISAVKITSFNNSAEFSQVGDVAFTTKSGTTEDLNKIPASTAPYQTTAASPYVDPRAPYHNWFELFSTFNAGEANYHAFEVEESHRMSHGFYLDGNYTLAKNLADNQGDTPTALPVKSAMVFL